MYHWKVHQRGVQQRSSSSVIRHQKYHVTCYLAETISDSASLNSPMSFQNDKWTISMRTGTSSWLTVSQKLQECIWDAITSFISYCLKEQCHESYQTSNSGNCHQIEWAAHTKQDTDGQIWRRLKGIAIGFFENLLT